MRRYLAYLLYVVKHKWFVFVECLRLSVPLWIAFCHDWDKFLPDEWMPYARTFYKPNGEHQYVKSIAFTWAWLRHQHRNKHHWQYWCCIDEVPLNCWDNVLIWDSGLAQEIVERNSGGSTWYELRDIDPARITMTTMPNLYIREMVADWRGAGRAQGNPDTKAWYLKHMDTIKLDPKTRLWVEIYLGVDYDDAIQSVWRENS